MLLIVAGARGGASASAETATIRRRAVAAAVTSIWRLDAEGVNGAFVKAAGLRCTASDVGAGVEVARRSMMVARERPSIPGEEGKVKRKERRVDEIFLRPLLFSDFFFPTFFFRRFVNQAREKSLFLCLSLSAPLSAEQFQQSLRRSFSFLRAQQGIPGQFLTYSISQAPFVSGKKGLRRGREVSSGEKKKKKKNPGPGRFFSLLINCPTLVGQSSGSKKVHGRLVGLPPGLTLGGGGKEMKDCRSDHFSLYFSLTSFPF